MHIESIHSSHSKFTVNLNSHSAGCSRIWQNISNPMRGFWHFYFCQNPLGLPIGVGLHNDWRTTSHALTYSDGEVHVHSPILTGKCMCTHLFWWEVHVHSPILTGKCMCTYLFWQGSHFCSRSWSQIVSTGRCGTVTSCCPRRPFPPATVSPSTHEHLSCEGQPGQWNEITNKHVSV